MSMRYNKIQYVAIALLLTTGMASCAYDKSTDIIPTPDNKELVLNIRTASVGGTTRSATNITDGGTTTTLTAAEQTITDLTLGVYNQSTGDLKGEVKNLTGVVNATATQFSQNFSASEAVYEAGDVVMVAINVNDAITNSSTKDNFWHNQLTIDQALTYGTSAVDASKLPMFGKAALTGGTDGLFTANVDVRHLVAKVSLASLAVDFDDDVAHQEGIYQCHPFRLLSGRDRQCHKFQGLSRNISPFSGTPDYIEHHTGKHLHFLYDAKCGRPFIPDRCQQDTADYQG